MAERALPHWLPGQILTIGVTGHRPERLGEANLPALHAAVASVLAGIDETAKSVGALTVRLVSALAEGADSIAADEALARSWTLDVVLPFHRGDYADDFAEGSARDAHLARLEHANAVFELPGDRTIDDGAKIAYERAGRVVLAQCDLLIAIWDNGPVRGRGGAAQIVAEAVLQGIPVIQIDPARMDAPGLLWDGLEEADLGQQSVETVARGGMDGLPGVIAALIRESDRGDDHAMLQRFVSNGGERWSASFAYPLLLAVMGVRRPRLADIRGAAPDAVASPIFATCSTGGRLAEHLPQILAPRFARADVAATRFAQTFRSGYVANFSLAAFAVVLSLLGLALPSAVKPVLIFLELGAIGIILGLTRVGNRAGWHRQWLDNRALAERLRCLTVLAQIGDLDLRGAGKQTPPWVAWYARATARELGLPSARVDDVYLKCVRGDLRNLLDAQIGYMSADAKRMHRLEHRLHWLGTVLFLATAATCLALLLFKTTYHWMPGAERLQLPFTVVATIISAALPAIGAAIYGIRMQGEFAGIAERNEALVAQLVTLKHVMTVDVLAFDTLHRRIRRATDLLTGDLESWLQTYHARPLALPG